MSCLAPLLLATAALFDPMPWVYRTGLASTAWVRAEGEAAGTGFVVDAKKRWLITCRHVVADRKTVDVFFPWHRDGELVTDRAEYLSNRETLRKLGLLVTGKVLRTSDAADLALVELPELPSAVRPIHFATTAAQPTDPLLAIGNRQDLDGLWDAIHGQVRQVNRLTEGYTWRALRLSLDADAVICQMPIEEGDSGGPVLNSRGELVGMLSATRRGCPEAAIAIDAREIVAFVDGKDENEAREERGPPNWLDLPPRYRHIVGATAWVRPNASDFHTAAVLIDPWKGLYLTSARGLGRGDRCAIAMPNVVSTAWHGDRKTAQDPIEGQWKAATVVLRDPKRDLALLQLERADAVGRTPLVLARRPPQPGEAIHAISHPGGLEFAWVYASGRIRQRGRSALGPRDNPTERVETLVLQLPSQGRSPGGPIVNDRGELVGILAAREGAAGQVGYAIAADEIAKFLDVAWPVGPARTWDGVLSRAVNEVIKARDDAIDTLLVQALFHQAVGKIPAAVARLEQALDLDPMNVGSMMGLAHILDEVQDRPRDAAALLDRLIDRGCLADELLAMRVRLAQDQNQHRLARSLAEVRAELNTRAAAFEPLAELHFALGDEEKAARAYRHAMLSGLDMDELCQSLIGQVEKSLKLNPDGHGRAAEWLRKVFEECSRTELEDTFEFKPMLGKAAAETSDQKRLAMLMKFTQDHAKSKP